MPFQLGSNFFVHADAVTKLIPLEGPRANQPFTIKACSKLDCKMNGKAISAMGNSIVPVAIALASAEPSFSIGLDVAQVSVDYAEHCGDGYMRMRHNLITTMTRPGLAPVTFKVVSAIIENGFGVASGAGEKVTDEISGKMLNLVLVYKGRDYDPFKLPGGVNIA